MSAMLSDEKWESLTFCERIHLCREQIQEAERQAQTADPDHKMQYERIAAEWRHIVAELEQFGTEKSAFPSKVGGLR